MGSMYFHEDFQNKNNLSLFVLTPIFKELCIQPFFDMLNILIVSTEYGLTRINFKYVKWLKVLLINY